MSVGAELMMRAILDTMGDAVLLSEFGDGCPLLDAAAQPPVRLARRPVGGVIRHSGLTIFAPPLDVFARFADCRRLALGRNLMVDAIVADAKNLIACADAFGPNSVAVLRLRGGGVLDAGLTLIYETRSGADRIYLRDDIVSDHLRATADALMAVKVDEFDALTEALSGSGVVASLRHGPRHSEAILNPATLLDQLDDRQIAEALGGGRAIMAADGGCSLSVPQLAGTPAPVTVRIGGLEDGAPTPIISLSNAPGWVAERHRTRDGLLVTAAPGPSTPPCVSLFMEIDANGSPDAEILEVTSAISRTRGAWEIWDEAQQRLELEESW